MAGVAESGSGRGFSLWRVAGWSAALLILLGHAVAMQLTDAVSWTGSDFLFAALMFGAVGGALEFAVRMSGNWAYRAAVVAALAAAFVIMWANAAVGMIGNEDDPYNLIFLGVIGLAMLGAVLARFRAPGMACAMAAAATAQIVIAAAGLSTDMRGGVLSAAFAGLWLLSAALFWKAAGERASS